MRISDWSSDVCSSDLIQRRRMESEAGALQQRIETLSIRGRRLQALGWVGGKETEGIEAKADHSLRAKGRHMGVAAQTTTEHGNLPTRKPLARDTQPQNRQSDEMEKGGPVSVGL